MAVCFATVFSASISQDTQDRPVVLCGEREYPIIAQVGCGNGRFGGVKLPVGYLAIGVNVGLLINTPDTLECAYVACVLRAQVALDGPCLFRHKLHHPAAYVPVPGPGTL